VALGSARQFGLIEPVKNGIRISALGLKVFEPASDMEYLEALKEAANAPSIFNKIIANFVEIPRSDEPIRSFLIRNLDFSKSGADDCISSFRETFAQLASQSSAIAEGLESHLQPNATSPSTADLEPERAPTEVRSLVPQDTIRIPLARDCAVDIRFSGVLSVAALDRLVRHIELMKEVWAVE
jgi:hypothetical protein